MAAYDLLKTATEVFLLLDCGVAHPGQEPTAFWKADLQRATRSWRAWAEQSWRRHDLRLTHYLGPGRLPYIERVVQHGLSRGDPLRPACSAPAS